MVRPDQVARVDIPTVQTRVRGRRTIRVVPEDPIVVPAVPEPLVRGIGVLVARPVPVRPLASARPLDRVPAAPAVPVALVVPVVPADVPVRPRRLWPKEKVR